MIVLALTHFDCCMSGFDELQMVRLKKISRNINSMKMLDKQRTKIYATMKNTTLFLVLASLTILNHGML